MMVDAKTLALQDSRLLPDSTKVAIRSYLGRAQDRTWNRDYDAELEALIGSGRAMTALLDTAVLPRAGRTSRLLVDVPGRGAREFRVTHVAAGDGGRATYTGTAVGDSILILLRHDSITRGRITTAAGVFNFRSSRLGLVAIAPEDRSGALPELHLIGSIVGPDLAADEYCPSHFSRTHHVDEAPC